MIIPNLYNRLKRRQIGKAGGVKLRPKLLNRVLAANFATVDQNRLFDEFMLGDHASDETHIGVDVVGGNVAPQVALL